MNPFLATPFARRKLRHQRAARLVLLAVLLAILLPLFAIIADLFLRAAPSLHWNFLVSLPSRGMREGGVWPAFIGTLYLVILSLAIAACRFFSLLAGLSSAVFAPVACCSSSAARGRRHIDWQPCPCAREEETGRRRRTDEGSGHARCLSWSMRSVLSVMCHAKVERMRQHRCSSAQEQASMLLWHG